MKSAPTSKIMKLSVLILALLIGVTLSASAQEPKAPLTPSPEAVKTEAPPIPELLIAQPTADSFQRVYSRSGKYSLMLPKSFGTESSEALTVLDDVALLRSQGPRFLAVNKLDHSDGIHYRPTQKLPDFPHTKTILTWQQNSLSKQLWTCRLAKLEDFQAKQMLVQATSKAAGITYELLFVMPRRDYLNNIP